MAKQQLDGAHIGAAFQQVSRERVPQRVWGNRLLDAGELAGLGARQPNGRSSNRSAGKVAWKEPRFGVRGLPIDPQDLQQSGREHDIAILLILCVRQTYVAMRSQPHVGESVSSY